MTFYSLLALLWLSGGFAIQQTFPTWALVLYTLASFVIFFAWALVRGGSLADEQ